MAGGGSKNKRIKKENVSQFVSITGVENETARYYLKAKRWNLEDALSMFYSNMDGRAIFRRQEIDLWESEEENGSNPSTPEDSLSFLYRQPLSVMFIGSFNQAKAAASFQNKWLIVNVQSNSEFNSHLLNRDTWANETVEETIRADFIFWQVYDDSEEGMKVCSYYRIASLPAILVVDPITGQKMYSHNGMIQPQDLLEVLLPRTEKSPKEHLFGPPQNPPDPNVDTSPTHIEDEIDDAAESVDAVSLEDSEEEESDAMFFMAEDTKPTYLPLPEEPKGSKETICRIGVRLPDGRRLQRTFLRTDPVELLWSFLCMKLDESEATKPFAFTHAIPGAKPKLLVAGSNLSFEEADLCNALVSLAWL